MKLLSDCTISNINDRFSKTEKGKTFTLQSKSSFSCDIIDIDGCLLEKEQIKKCDWLFLVPNKDKIVKQPKAYYVELKGINIDEACEQLYNAIDKTKGLIPAFDIEAKVISIRGGQPEIMNSGYYKKVRKLIKKDIDFCKVHKGNRFTHVEII